MATNRKLLKKDSTIFMGALENYRKQNPNTEAARIAEWVYNASHMWSESRPELADQTLSPNFIINRGKCCRHYFSLTFAYRSLCAKRKNMRGFAKALHSCIDEYQYCVDDIIHQGALQDGKVAIRARHRGIWKLELPELPLTKEIVGKEFEHRTCSIMTKKNGMAQELWTFDAASQYPVLPQLGGYFMSFIKEEK